MTNYVKLKENPLDLRMRKTEQGYSKIIKSGELEKEHYSYGIGAYDVSIFYYYNPQTKIHFVRVWFGTIDDGDFGSWTEYNSEEEALIGLEKIAEVFKAIDECPNSRALNILFNPLKVVFKHE